MFFNEYYQWQNRPKHKDWLNAHISKNVPVVFPLKLSSDLQQEVVYWKNTRIQNQDDPLSDG